VQLSLIFCRIRSRQYSEIQDCFHPKKRGLAYAPEF
jgi:hypothetical protein